MTEVSELVVAAKPEGLEETADGFEEIQDGVQETANEMQETTGQFEDLQSRWQGAMGAIVAGLAVATGGILSQVPILGEAMSALGGIAAATGFQIDRLARKLGAEGLTNSLFNAQTWIFNLEGAAADLFAATAALTTGVISLTSAIAGLGALIPGLSAFGAVSTVFSTLAGWVTTLTTAFVGFISGSLAAAAALGAFIGTLGVAILEVTGVLDAVRGLGETIGSGLPSWVRDGLLAVSSLFIGTLGVIGGFILGFVQGFLEGGLSEGIDRAVSTSIEVLDVFVGAWKRTVDNIKSAIEMLIGFVGDMVNEIANQLDRLSDRIDSVSDRIPGSISGGISIGGLDIGGGGGDSGGGGNDGFTAQRSQTANVYMDGRNLTNNTGRYRSDRTSRRGRFG